MGYVLIAILVIILSGCAYFVHKDQKQLRKNRTQY